jgi:CheY-like chemotaxis protein
MLFVDDDDASRNIIKTLLKSRGINITIAEDGMKAIIAFKEKPFDVVMMDYKMPHMDGIQAASAIRKIDKNNTPIFAITGNIDLIPPDKVDLFDEICDKKDMLSFVERVISAYQ